MEEKKKLEWWQKNCDMPIEINDAPIIVNKTNIKNSEFIKLQDDINKLVYEFVKTHDIPDGFSIDYGIDDLASLKEYGVGCPFCDGYLTIHNFEKESLVTSM